MSGEILLSVDDVRVHYPTETRGQTIKAVDGVSFEVRRGKTLGIIGESGSGKSTLARTLVALAKPTSGTIRHDGVDPFTLSRRALRSRRRAFQMIFQDPHGSLDPRKRIIDSVMAPLAIAGGRPYRVRKAIALETLDHVGLSAAIADRYPHELSGGQKQRANIARVLTLRPDLVVCDEVTAALDVSIQAGILNLFLSLQAEYGLTYVYITHDLGVALHVCDSIAVMYLGRIVEQMPATGVLRHSRHPYTRALLAADPVALPSHLRPPKTPPLRGEMPSPIAPPSGCRFRTRCPLATALCAESEPSSRAVGEDHMVACHYAETVDAAGAARAVAVA